MALIGGADELRTADARLYTGQLREGLDLAATQIYDSAVGAPPYAHDDVGRSRNRVSDLPSQNPRLRWLAQGDRGEVGVGIRVSCVAQQRGRPDDLRRFKRVERMGSRSREGRYQQSDDQGQSEHGYRRTAM